MINKIFDYPAHSHNPADFVEAFNLTEEYAFSPHHYITDHTKTLDETLDRTILEYDKNNITKGLLSGPNSDYWIEKYPHRFLHSTRVNLTEDIENQVSVFENQVAMGKTSSLGEFGLAYAGKKLDLDILFPFYEVYEKNRIPVLLHTGLNGPQAVNNMPHWRITNSDPLLFESV